MLPVFSTLSALCSLLKRTFDRAEQQMLRAEALFAVVAKFRFLYLQGDRVSRHSLPLAHPTEFIIASSLRG